MTKSVTAALDMPCSLPVSYYFCSLQTIDTKALDGGVLRTKVQPAAKTTSTGKGPDVQRRGEGQVYSGGRTAKAEQRRGETLKESLKPGRQIERCFIKGPRCMQGAECAMHPQDTSRLLGVTGEVGCWTWSSTTNGEKAGAHP